MDNDYKELISKELKLSMKTAKPVLETLDKILNINNNLFSIIPIDPNDILGIKRSVFIMDPDQYSSSYYGTLFIFDFDNKEQYFTNLKNLRNNLLPKDILYLNPLPLVIVNEYLRRISYNILKIEQKRMNYNYDNILYKDFIIGLLSNLSWEITYGSDKIPNYDVNIISRFGFFQTFLETTFNNLDLIKNKYSEIEEKYRSADEKYKELTRYWWGRIKNYLSIRSIRKEKKEILKELKYIMGDILDNVWIGMGAKSYILSDIIGREYYKKYGYYSINDLINKIKDNEIYDKEIIDLKDIIEEDIINSVKQNYKNIIDILDKYNLIFKLKEIDPEIRIVFN